MSETRSSTILKAAYVASVVIMCFGFFVSQITSGLDTSWLYGLNLNFAEGTLWGRDVIFTYGPLGILLHAKVLGNNALFGLIFWVVIVSSAGALYAYVLFSPKMSRINQRSQNITASLFMLYIGAFFLRGVLPEYLPLFLVLSMLSLCWQQENLKLFIASAAFAVLFGFMKFTMTVTAFGALCMFTLASYLTGRKHRNTYLAVSLSVPVIICACFLLYNPSLEELKYYLRGMYEISSGYNSAMSFSMVYFKTFGKIVRYAIMALMLVILAINIKIFQLGKIRHEWGYAAIYAPFLFFMYKHSFVRFDPTWIRFVSMFLVYASVYVLFMKDELHFPEVREVRAKKFLCVLFCLTLIVSSAGMEHKIVRSGFDLLRRIVPKAKTMSYGNYKFMESWLTNPLAPFMRKLANVPAVLGGSLETQDERELKTPESFLASVRSESTAVYPWEISHVCDFPDTKKIMPVLQAYSAYTPWLDSQDAKFFAEDERAPHFVIFCTEDIDDRFPLIDSPAAWLELFRRYRIVASDTKHFDDEDKDDRTEFLLERVDTENLSTRHVSSLEVPRDGVINIPDTEGWCIMRLDMRLSLLGQAARFFWKIPPVWMTAEFEDGSSERKRVLPEVMSNGVLISSLVLDAESFAAIMGEGKINRVKSVQFSGAGLKYYAPSVKVTFEEFER